MRMTNKIMRNNSLYNINQTKIMEDKLTNQMTNQSKIRWWRSVRCVCAVM